MLSANFNSINLCRDKTPLHTLEAINTSIGIFLASPFLYDDNKESGNRCLYTGIMDGDWLWTNRCNTDNIWQAWDLKPINGNQNRFYLVHKPTGRCAKIFSNSSNSNVYSTSCTKDSSMIWSWINESMTVF